MTVTEMGSKNPSQDEGNHVISSSVNGIVQVSSLTKA